MRLALSAPVAVIADVAETAAESAPASVFGEAVTTDVAAMDAVVAALLRPAAVRVENPEIALVRAAVSASVAAETLPAAAIATAPRRRTTVGPVAVTEEATVMEEESALASVSGLAVTALLATIATEPSRLVSDPVAATEAAALMAVASGSVLPPPARGAPA